VAVLSHQPQGGFITRKPTQDVLVADRDDGMDDGGFASFFFGRDPEPQPRNPRQRGGRNPYPQPFPGWQSW
jgi:hypothetical protein